MLASPLCVITEYNKDKLLIRICDIVKKYNVQLIVVGHPKNMDGSRGQSAQKCAEFAQLLHEHSNIQTILWDERCTTMSCLLYTSVLKINLILKKRQTVLLVLKLRLLLLLLIL